MGYWDTSANGESFTGDGSMVWGDAPADQMDGALDTIRDIFIKDVGRPPTVGELKAGLLFSLGALRYEKDEVPFTPENFIDASDKLIQENFRMIKEIGEPR